MPQTAKAGTLATRQAGSTRQIGEKGDRAMTMRKQSSGVWRRATLGALVVVLIVTSFLAGYGEMETAYALSAGAAPSCGVDHLVSCTPTAAGSPAATPPPQG